MTPFTHGSQGSVLCFMLIVAGVIATYIWWTYIAHRGAGAAAARQATVRFVVGLLVWLGGFTAFVSSGVLQEGPLPFVPLTLIGVNLVSLVFALSPAGGRLARHVPTAALVAFQGFRLPLELVLHEWGEQRVIPMAMTWAGSNLDIITGITALVLAPFSARPAVAWVANVTGLILLANVARVALMSSPVPFGWPVEPKLMLVAHLPYAYIAPVCVAGALVGHVILTRRLVGQSSRRD